MKNKAARATGKQLGLTHEDDFFSINHFSRRDVFSLLRFYNFLIQDPIAIAMARKTEAATSALFFDLLSIL
jgi:hypothetical protein